MVKISLCLNYGHIVGIQSILIGCSTLPLIPFKKDNLKNNENSPKTLLDLLSGAATALSRWHCECDVHEEQHKDTTMSVSVSCGLCNKYHQSVA